MDSLEASYLPCFRSSECENNAVKQLLALNSSEFNCMKESGDPGYQSQAKVKKIREKEQDALKTKDSTTNATEDREKTKGVDKEKTTADSCQLDDKSSFVSILTAADVYERLAFREISSNFAVDFCGWQLCPLIHASPVLFGIADASRLAIKPRARKVPTLLQLPRSIANGAVRATSGVSKHGGARASSLPTKLIKACPSRTRSDGLARPGSRSSQPTSSTGREEQMWQEPPPHPLPIHYSFKYLMKHPRQYSDQYRETYTYNRLKERFFTTSRSPFVTGGAVARSRLRCVNNTTTRDSVRVKTVPGNKPALAATPICPDADNLKSSAIKWQMNQQLLEACDLELSVNNPLPTEIAMLSKIPHVYRSSPSIPSNTNGKYGGKGTDKPYPFQLNISADAQTIIAPSVKKIGRSIYIHRSPTTT